MFDFIARNDEIALGYSSPSLNSGASAAAWKILVGSWCVLAEG